MPVAAKPKQIDALMEKASQALVRTDYFEAERIAAQAVALARQVEDFERLARIVMPLQEARRQRVQIALEAEEVTVWEGPVEEHPSIEPGCYLVQPPQVGADARRLRLAALEQRVPIAVVCREPTTTIKLVPIVAIGPGVTVRVKIDRPDDETAPDMDWFVDAMEAIGDAAIEHLDPGLATLKRLNALIARTEAIPDHEGLHHALEETARQAGREQQADRENGGPPRRGRRKKSGTTNAD